MHDSKLITSNDSQNVDALEDNERVKELIKISSSKEMANQFFRAYNEIGSGSYYNCFRAGNFDVTIHVSSI